MIHAVCCALKERVAGLWRVSGAPAGVLLLCVCVLAAACTPQASATVTALPAALATETPVATAVPDTATPPPPMLPTATLLPTRAAPTPMPTGPALPAAPQEIEFAAEDGQALKGYYYPAARNPAPVVVLMHWAPGSQEDWKVIAPWLQNRQQAGALSRPGPKRLYQQKMLTVPWLDPSWFPSLPEGCSYAVFTFTFRDCDFGCQSTDPALYLLDARAAMAQAGQLPGVDASRMVAIGASIGADGAVDACQAGCVGAVSLSPGSYLNVPYAEAVAGLGQRQPAVPVLCLTSENDRPSVEACDAASGEHYQKLSYPGNAHGMQLIQPRLEPNVLQLVLNFLERAFGS